MAILRRLLRAHSTVGHAIDSLEDLFSALRTPDPGDTVELRILCGGEEVAAEVERADWPTTS